jgi:hypothetical protein
MLGALSRRRAMSWLGFVTLLLILTPFMDVILDELPLWLLLAILLLSVWFLFRFVAEALLGRKGAAYMMGILAANAVRAVFRFGLIIAALPFRLIRWAWRATH